MLSRIAAQDPEAALARSAEVLRGGRRFDFITRVVRNWNVREPEGPLAWALAQPAGSARDQALLTLMDTIALEDPARAFELASSLQQEAAADAMVDVLGVWVHTDPAAAVAHIADVPLPARQRVTRHVASSWAERAPEEALAWARALPSARERESALNAVFLAVAWRDPMAGLEMALRTEEAPDQVIRDCAYSAATQDVAATLALVQSMPAGVRRDAVLSRIVAIVSDTEPERAAVLAAGLSSAEDRAAAYDDVARTLAAEDPAAAARWAAGLDDSAGATHALKSAVGTWARNDPRAAASFVQSLPRGELRDEAEFVLVSDWAELDPQRAAGWVLSHGGEQPRLLSRLLYWWTDIDEEQAADWARSLPAGETRDGALVALISAVEPDGDPADAWSYIEDIGDEQLRDEGRRLLFDQWHARAPEEARAFVEQADLPDEVRSELLAPAPAGGCVCPGEADELADEVAEHEDDVEAEEAEELPEA